MVYSDSLTCNRSRIDPRYNIFLFLVNTNEFSNNSNNDTYTTAAAASSTTTTTTTTTTTNTTNTTTTNTTNTNNTLTSGPQLVYQRPWYVLFCLWKSAYKRSLAAYRKE